MKISLKLVAAVSGLLMTLWFPTAFAELEEVIVTAQKREQSVQDVGLTVSVFDEDAFRELTRGTLDGLAAQMSNVQAYAANTFLQSVHIRGIGLNEFQGQYDSPVAQHIDEVYIAKPWMIARRHYDVQRVEALKGPQGTLFGRNTTGGSVNFYTNAPSQDFAASLQFGIDEHERYVTEGMINGALTEDLSGRLSMSTEFGSGGPQKNLFTGEEHGAPNIIDLRGQLLWEGENLTVRALVHGGIDKSEKVAWKAPGIFNLGGGFCPELLTGEVIKNPETCAKYAGLAILNGFPDAEFEPGDAFTINQNTPPAVDDTFYGGYLNWEYDMGWAKLTSITAFEYYERIHREDSQSDPFDSTSTHYYDEMNQVTQELRLAGNLAEQWRYVLGFFYEHDSLDQSDGSDLSGQLLPILPPFATQFFAQFKQDFESIALFGHTEFDFTDNLTINAGLRVTTDHTKVNDVLLGLGNLPQVGDEKFVTPCLITTVPGGPIGTPACPFLGPEAPFYDDDRRDNNLSWRVGLEWTPEGSEDFMIYGNLTTGYRNGGYSLPFAGAATTFEPEKVFSQEFGVKSQWLNRTVQVNAALFQYLYNDVQVNVDDPVSPLVPITRNIGEQKNVGAEVDVNWVPDDRWFFRQSAGWLQAVYENTDRVISTYAGPISLEGKHPVNSPKWTYNGAVRYEQPIFAGWNGSLGFDYRWVGKRSLEATGQPFDSVGSYWLANMRAAVTSADKKWEVAIYGTNLFDEEYVTYINNIGFFRIDIYGQTQTFGATVRYQFQ